MRHFTNLLAAMTSASSKNKMLGAASRALRKVFRNNASPSPTYIEYNSAPLCEPIIKMRTCYNINHKQQVHGKFRKRQLPPKISRSNNDKTYSQKYPQALNNHSHGLKS